MPKYVSLENHPTIDERWLQDRLHGNTELLGLGDVLVRDRERRQPSGGRLDMLLEDVEQRTRYEVEIQLGAMDESHIIRTIEYWDIERRRYPQYEHVAVIVAEDVTSRFLNVVSLFNGTIPLMVIQLKGVEVDGAFTLLATRVVDLVRLGTEEEDEGESINRSSWEHKASMASLQVMDQLVDLIRELYPGVEPRYTVHYIGLAFDGRAQNFVSFIPRKSHYVLTSFKIPQNDETTSRLNDSGLAVLSYDSAFGNYRVQIRQSDLGEHRSLLLELIREAYTAYMT
ncbi:MAG: hypothetical protein OXD46_08865 [Chloroflexi bacterium]|nr:hypothetical protein [Chloroflexota bacterium]